MTPLAAWPRRAAMVSSEKPRSPATLPKVPAARCKGTRTERPFLSALVYPGLTWEFVLRAIIVIRTHLILWQASGRPCVHPGLRCAGETAVPSVSNHLADIGRNTNPHSEYLSITTRTGYAIAQTNGRGTARSTQCARACWRRHCQDFVMEALRGSCQPPFKAILCPAAGFANTARA